MSCNFLITFEHMHSDQTLCIINNSNQLTVYDSNLIAIDDQIIKINTMKYYFINHINKNDKYVILTYGGCYAIVDTINHTHIVIEKDISHLTKHFSKNYMFLVDLFDMSIMYRVSLDGGSVVKRYIDYKLVEIYTDFNYVKLQYNGYFYDVPIDTFIEADIITFHHRTGYKIALDVGTPCYDQTWYPAGSGFSVKFYSNSIYVSTDSNVFKQSIPISYGIDHICIYKGSLYLTRKMNRNENTIKFDVDRKCKILSEDVDCVYAVDGFLIDSEIGVFADRWIIQETDNQIIIKDLLKE